MEEISEEEILAFLEMNRGKMFTKKQIYMAILKAKEKS